MDSLKDLAVLRFIKNASNSVSMKEISSETNQYVQDVINSVSVLRNLDWVRQDPATDQFPWTNFMAARFEIDPNQISICWNLSNSIVFFRDR